MFDHHAQPDNPAQGFIRKAHTFIAPASAFRCIAQTPDRDYSSSRAFHNGYQAEVGISYHLQGVYMSPVATPTTPPLQLITIDRRHEDMHSSCKVPAPRTQAPTKRHTYRMMALASVHAYIAFLDRTIDRLHEPDSSREGSN